MARESQSATGLPGGIAIPHCRDASITNASLGFARLDPKVDFGAPDGPADLVFLIAAPEGAGAEHMKLLSSLARALVKPDFVTALREAKEPTDVVALVDGVLNPAPKAPACHRCRTGRDCRRRGYAGSRGRQEDRRGHRVPHRHRAHLHGGRLAGRRG